MLCRLLLTIALITPLHAADRSKRSKVDLEQALLEKVVRGMQRPLQLVLRFHAGEQNKDVADLLQENKAEWHRHRTKKTEKLIEQVEAWLLKKLLAPEQTDNRNAYMRSLDQQTLRARGWNSADLYAALYDTNQKHKKK